MKKILFLCNTHFQCIVATVFKNTMFKDDKVDLIITDQMVDSIRLFEKIKKSDIFNIVYHTDIKKYYLKKKNVKYYLNILKAELFPSRLANVVDIKGDSYDFLFTYNLDFFAESLFYKLTKQNRNIKICLYDEGVSTYSEVYKNTIYSSGKRIDFIKNISRVLRKRKYISECVKDLYLLDPDLLCWDFPGEVHKIILPEVNDKVFINTLNKIYDYEEIQDIYDRKYIFFEESYFWDNQPINDVELVKIIARTVSKDNLMIKLHPRNRINRFEPIGYKTNQQVGIPWEVIVMNMNNDKDKTFITVSSGSVLSYKLIFGKSFKTIMLYKCLNNEDSNFNEDYIKYFEKFKKKYSDNLYIPENFEELDELLNFTRVL